MSTSTYKINKQDAIAIWLRYWAGEYQHNIAASYGVNPGRINEVLKRRKFLESEKLAAEQKGKH